MTQSTEDLIKELIATEIPCEFIYVEGDGTHFFATIVSEAFTGKRLIQRHQMVYGILGDRMKEEIHALSMTTLTPEEHKAKQG